jgi:hypothetical protein
MEKPNIDNISLDLMARILRLRQPACNGTFDPSPAFLQSLISVENIGRKWDGHGDKPKGEGQNPHPNVAKPE